jgi:hypothetical protein
VGIGISFGIVDGLYSGLGNLLGALKAGESCSVQRPTSCSLRSRQYRAYFCMNGRAPRHCTIREEEGFQIRFVADFCTSLTSPGRTRYMRKRLATFWTASSTGGEVLEVSISDNVAIALVIVCRFLNAGIGAQGVFVIANPDNLPSRIDDYRSDVTF